MISLNKNKKILLLLGTILVFLLLGIPNTKSQEIDCTDHSCDYSCSDTIDSEAKEKCKKLEEQCKANLKVCELKVKQQDTLVKQLEVIDQEQKSNLNQLYETKKEVTDLGEEIEVLEKDIEEKKEIIEKQKKIIAGLVQRYYEYHKDGVLNIVLAAESMGTVLSQSDYLEQSGTKITDMLSELQEVKRILEEDQNELEDKKKEEEEKKEKLENQYYSLRASEQQKQNLLEVTQGEEEKYQQILAKLERQKEQLFNFSEATNISELFGSLDDYDRPDKDDWASTSWYYSQRDSRWDDDKIGNTNSTLEDYGCAITSVAMVFKYFGASIDPGKLADKPIFYQDLIVWPTSWSPGIKRVSSVYHGNVDWDEIDDQLDDDNPVIVYIKRSAGGGHYVVITDEDKEDYIVHDPYFGPNLYLGTSRSLVGKLGTKSSTSIDQMIIYN